MELIFNVVPRSEIKKTTRSARKSKYEPIINAVRLIGDENAIALNVSKNVDLKYHGVYNTLNNKFPGEFRIMKRVSNDGDNMIYILRR